MTKEPRFGTETCYHGRGGTGALERDLPVRKFNAECLCAVKLNCTSRKVESTWATRSICHINAS